MRKWRMLDTFSGIGGFSLAAEWTGRISPVQFIEIDPWCRRVLAKHWPEVPQHDDIRTFLADADSGRQQQRHAGEWRLPESHTGSIDLITGGFPCQPFSAAGKRGGADDDRYLWPELHRVIAVVRPRWCLLENVRGIVGMAGGLDRVCADLEAVGYEVGCGVIPAAAVGAYHRRDRVWIVAHAEGGTGQCEQGQRQGIRDEPAIHGTQGHLADVAHALQERHGGESHAAGGHHANGSAARWEEGAGRVAERGPDVAHAAARGLRRGGAPGGTGLATQRGEDVGYASGNRVEGERSRREQESRAHGGALISERPGATDNGHETLGRLGDTPDDVSRWVARRPPTGPAWEDGIPRVTAHEHDRVNKLKALGNSIVPQVAYELMRIMLDVDDVQTDDECG